MSSATNNQIIAKHAVANIIKQVVPNAVVYPWWVIGKGIGNSLTELTTTTDTMFVTTGTKFIHGYCVGFGTNKRAHIANNVKYGDTVTLKVWGFYQVVTGTKDKNSEDEFWNNLNTIVDAFSKSPRLVYDELYDGIEGVKSHNDLQFDDELDTYGFGSDTQVWIAKGNLEVEFSKQLV